MHQRSPLGVGNHQLHGRDGQTLAHAAALIHLLVLASGEGHLLDHLAHVLRYVDLGCAPLAPGFLGRDGHAFFDGLGIVGADFRADPVFERSDDFASCGVVLGISAEGKNDVQFQADGISLNLHIAFLHDVEERHLDLPGQIRKLVDSKDPAIGPGSRP